MSHLEHRVTSPGNCLHGVALSEPCDLCLIVSDINGGPDGPDWLAFFSFERGVPNDPDATVLTECMHCINMVETRTGCRGIDDALSQGWEIDGAGDLVCPSCSEARADLIGDER